MKITPTHKQNVRKTNRQVSKVVGATLLALLVPTHFVFAASIWDTMTSWGKGLVSAVTDFGVDLLLTPLVWIAHFVNWVANLFMEAMGYMLDTSISYTLDSSIYKSVSAIQVGWTAVRDFSNMFFIFVLLYIAILTILGMAGSSTKRWVAHVIISALLINFSLFITQVVVDAGNILALGFWNKMITQQGANKGPSASVFFMEGFRVQTEFDTITDGTGAKVKVTKTQQIMIYLGGAAVSFVAGYVFLAGAVMMIVRSVTLMLLMISSPFAFLSFGLPKRGEFWGKWTGQLIGSTFMAPAFIFMLYIDMLIIRGTGSGGELIKASGADNAKFALAFAGQVANFSIIYNFVLMIILLLAALTVANNVSSGAGTQGGQWAKRLIGGGAAMSAAGAAMAGRQTIGRMGRNDMQNQKWVEAQNRLVARAGMKDATIREKMRGRLASGELRLSQAASKGTYDARNAKVAGVGVNTILAKTNTGVNIGEGGKKSYESGGQALSSVTGAYRGTEKEKEILENAKNRFTDADAQRAYAERKGVEIEKVEGKVDRNKTVREALNKQIAADAERLHPGDAEAQQDYLKGIGAERIQAEAKRLHPFDPAAQQKYLDENKPTSGALRDELVKERGLVGYDPKTGKAVYGVQTKIKNVWDTPQMKEQRLKLQTQVTTQLTQQAIQSAIDSTDLSIDPKTGKPKNQIFAALPEDYQKILKGQANHTIRDSVEKSTPQAISQMSEDYLKHSTVSQHLNPAQLRAISANAEVKESTLRDIQNNVYTAAEAEIAAGRDPNATIPSLDTHLSARSDSRLNQDPQRTKQIRDTIEANKKTAAEARETARKAAADASKATADAAAAAAKKTADSARFAELFSKTTRTPAEEAELKNLRDA